MAIPTMRAAHSNSVGPLSTHLPCKVCMPGTWFAFDLDGTITTREILPTLACELGLEEEMGLLTRLTLDGTLDFAASFRLRFQLLRSIPLTRVREIVSAVPLDPDMTGFIKRHSARCCVITGNLDAWIAPLAEQLGCPFFCSTSTLYAGEPVLGRILDKAEATRSLRRNGRRIVCIGESHNDIPMFREADTGIAYAGVHSPAPALAALAHHTAYTGEELCRLLEEFL